MWPLRLLLTVTAVVTICYAEDASEEEKRGGARAFVESPKSTKIDPDNGTWPNYLPENNSLKRGGARAFAPSFEDKRGGARAFYDSTADKRGGARAFSGIETRGGARAFHGDDKRGGARAFNFESEEKRGGARAFRETRGGGHVFNYGEEMDKRGGARAFNDMEPPGGARAFNDYWKRGGARGFTQVKRDDGSGTGLDNYEDIPSPWEEETHDEIMDKRGGARAFPGLL